MAPRWFHDAVTGLEAVGILAVLVCLGPLLLLGCVFLLDLETAKRSKPKR